MRTRAWLSALAIAFVLLALLGWLLARLVWLYYYFGLFFFLVAGLLVGGVAFRIARAARPVSKRRIISGSVIVSLLACVVTVVWEFRNFAGTVGEPPRFAMARNAKIAAGRPPSEVGDEAALTFRQYLVERFPPGGAVGYVHWAIRGSPVKLRLPDGKDEATITIPHRGWVWPVRTLAEVALMALGLWFSFESLRAAEPVSNILPPGAEYLEEDEE